jgi:hypothetical protein
MELQLTQAVGHRATTVTGVFLQSAVFCDIEIMCTCACDACVLGDETPVTPAKQMKITMKPTGTAGTGREVAASSSRCSLSALQLYKIRLEPPGILHMCAVQLDITVVKVTPCDTSSIPVQHGRTRTVVKVTPCDTSSIFLTICKSGQTFLHLLKVC